VIASVTSGIATRLASSPTSETWWKKAMVSGASPTVATSWVRSMPRTLAHACPRRRRHRLAPASTRQVAATTWSASVAISSATATKDSQKPGCSSAQGSHSVTTAAVAHSTAGQGHWRPACASSVTAPSISTVRCAGTPQPANTA